KRAANSAIASSPCPNCSTPACRACLLCCRRNPSPVPLPFGGQRGLTGFHLSAIFRSLGIKTMEGRRLFPPANPNFRTLSLLGQSALGGQTSEVLAIPLGIRRPRNLVRITRPLCPWLLLGAASLLFFSRLSLPLLEPEETRYAEIPRQMLAEGRLLTPV